MITKEQKSNLAKLLATENINVQHRKVQTAYFVPKTRTLCLPIWQDMTNDLYDLLVGHEVGHALYTPLEVEEIKKSKIPHSYYNVVEDIRIDKKMKLKYPGLKKSYYYGYNELIEKDFFNIKEKDVNKLRFIDRLNIFSKSGQRQLIEFSDVEQEFINRSDNLETWQDVCDLVKDIFAYSQDEEYDNQEENEALTTSGDMGEFDLDEESEQSVDGEQNENQEQSEEEQEQKSGNEKDEDDKDEGASTSSKNDNDETGSKEDKPKENKVGTQSGGYNPDAETNAAITDNAYEENKKSLTDNDEKTKDNLYVTLPKKKDCVIPYSTISKHIERANPDEKGYTHRYSKSKNNRAISFKKFKDQNNNTINYMVKEFEMKKAADAYVKTRTARTGALNMNKLHSYKYNEDIFARINIVPGEKNHGMIMVIDWSGSMSGQMKDTIEQTLNLVMFCKKVNIPFAVYAFTDINRKAFSLDGDEFDGFFARARAELKNTPYEYTKENEYVFENVSLLEFVTSDMKKTVFNQAMADLYGIAEHYGLYQSRAWRSNPEDEVMEIPNILRLGGTPLDSAIYQSIDVVNNFQKKHKVQKMTTIYLTDGCGHQSGLVTKEASQEMKKYGSLDTESVYESNIVMTDKTHSFNYGYRFNNTHKPMFEYFKLKTGSALVGFYITSKRTVQYYDWRTFSGTDSYEAYDNARKNVRKEKFMSIENVGYDILFLIPRQNLKIDDGKVEIDESMTASKMKTVFSRTLKNKKFSRVLLNKFIERIA